MLHLVPLYLTLFMASMLSRHPEADHDINQPKISRTIQWLDHLMGNLFVIGWNQGHTCVCGICFPRKSSIDLIF